MKHLLPVLLVCAIVSPLHAAETATASEPMFSTEIVAGIAALVGWLIPSPVGPVLAKVIPSILGLFKKKPK